MSTRDQADEIATLRQELDTLRPVVEAAKAWRAELIRLGHYQPGEAATFNPLRSDRWPFEVSLVAAVDALDVVSAPLISAADEAKIPQPEPHDLEARLAKAERERDSLARRCAARFEETEVLRATVRYAEADRDALRLAATHLVQLVDHGADGVVIGGAIPALRRALDGGGQ